MKKVFLVGNPLGHSWSPEIHAHFGGYSYELKPLEAYEVDDFIKNGEYDGLNVTIPYKRDVIPLLDEISPEAERIGAVNTIVRKGGRLCGYNTDYAGFSYLLDYVGIDVCGKKVLVLGSGGSSHTVRTVLADRGATETVVISRSGENNYENIARHADADVIVNTTPVGMYPKNGVSPVDIGLFPHLCGVVDLIYNPEKTALILDTEERNIPCASGLTMLVSQAKAAAELFTGETIPDGKICETVDTLRREKRNIILIGMPGCGKTSVGRALASLLRRKFADTDEMIEAETGSTPAVLIKEKGEARFREIETDVLREITKESTLVISAGGGAVTKPENIRLMRQNGTVVLIMRPLDELVTDGRPLSQQYGLDALWNSRQEAYFSVADITLDALFSPEKTAKAIKERLKL